MSESNQAQPKQLLLVSLVLLLFVIVCVQAWHMVEMEKQLDSANTQTATTQLPTEDVTAQAVPQTDTVTPGDITNNQQTSPQDNQAEEQPLPTNDDVYNSPLYAELRDPYEDLRRMQQHMDRVFNDRYSRLYNNPGYQRRYSQHISTPKINIRENINQYVVFVNIPGTDEDNISVNLEGQRLTIKARQGYEKKDRDESGHIIFRERQSGRFQRSIMLPERINPNGMRTHADNGVLTIIIPKARY